MKCECVWDPSFGITLPSVSCPVHGAGKLLTQFAKQDHDRSTRKLDEVTEAVQGQGDDRHTFSSGASSSGRKPPYSAITQHSLERFANQRGYGDNKYGIDNWRKGANDKEFILDRINHGIEHLLKLADQVKRGSIGMMGIPGEDDAAAVMCNAMFVMEWQRMQVQSEGMAQTARKLDVPIRYGNPGNPETDRG